MLRYRFRNSACIIAVIALLQSTSASAEVLNYVAAVVNDDVITYRDVMRESSALLKEADKKNPADSAARSSVYHAALERLIDRRLVDQKVKELGIRVSDDEIRNAIEDVKRQNSITTQDALVAALAGQGISYDQYREQLREQIEKVKLLGQEVRGKVQIGESEVREYYEKNSQQFREEETFRARHIFFKKSDKATDDEIKRTMATALQVLADARDNKDFVELAKKYSEDPAAAANGGDLGTFRKGDMLPELEQVIVGMKAGEVSELVTTPAGLHIIRLDQRISGRVKPLESVKAEVEELLYRKRTDERFNLWTKELRAKATIEVKDKKL